MQIILDQSSTGILNFTDWWVIRKVWTNWIILKVISSANLTRMRVSVWIDNWSYFLPFLVLFSTTMFNFMNLVISYLQGWKKSTTSKSLSFLTASNVLSVRAGTSSLNVEVTLALSTVADTSSSSVSSAEKE